MNLKSLLALSAALLAFCASAQNKEFSFDDIQSRNNLQQWEKYPSSGIRTVSFTPERIELKVDKAYHLNIIQKTHLPDKGVIYLCKDEKQHDITVMLVSDDRMFLYNDRKRFLINFNHPPLKNAANSSYADND